MRDFINASGGLLPAVLILVLAMNAFLTGLKSALEYVKDKTVTDADNKVHATLAKVLGFLTSLIDVLTANKPH